MIEISERAPCGIVSDYDRKHLALYAALIEAEEEGRSWSEAAVSVMGLDIGRGDAEECWRSHLERARWIVGDGMADAIAAFNTRPRMAKPS